MLKNFLCKCGKYFCYCRLVIYLIYWASKFYRKIYKIKVKIRKNKIKLIKTKVSIVSKVANKLYNLHQYVFM